MKKYLLITLLFCCLMGFAQNGRIGLRSTTRADITKSDYTTLQAVFSFGSIESMELSTEKGTFSEISLEGCYPSGEIGTPELPAAHQLLAVPFGATPTVSIKSFSATDYQLSDYGINTILPHQPSVRKDQNLEDVKFIYDEAAYQTRGLSAAPAASIEVQGTMRGVRVGSLVVNPLSYDATSNTLRVFNDIEVSVEFEGADQAETERMLLNTYSPYFDIVYKQFFNSRQILDVYDDHPDLMAYPVHMVVVTPENYVSTLQPWIDWKVQKGFDVNVVTTAQAGGNYNAIRSYVQNLYNTGVNNGATPTFLILVGDVAQVPNITGSNSQKVTDLYYGSVDNDYFPDMFYSRMSAENTTQLSNIINKILQYEQYTMPDPSYLSNVLLIAGWDNGWNPTVAQPTINYATTYYYNTAHGFNNVYTYLTQGQYTGCYNNLNTGVGFVNYTAHGNETSWQSPSFSNSNVNALTNNGKYFLAMGNCCLAANFGYGQPCFGETMIRAENKAAYSYIGSCPSTYWYEDYYFALGATHTHGGAVPSNTESTTGCYDGIWMDDTYNTVSSIVFLGNLAVCKAHTGGYQTHSNPTYYWQAYHVLGDGSIMPYRVNPTPNTVSHTNSIMMGASYFTVYAEEGSYVGISKDNQLLGAALVPATGVVNVNITPVNQPGNLHIVVTKPQRQPYVTDITVINPEPGTITVSADPEEGGTVTGGGTFDYGTPCTVTATALGEYSFRSWSEDGVAVANTPEYTFTVTGDRHLVANFNLPPCYTPSGLTASVSGTIVDLSWQATSNAVSYGLFRDGNLIADNITELNYQDTGLESNTEYCYMVFSNCANGESSDPSKAACVTTEAVVVPCDPAEGFDAEYVYTNENEYGVLLKWTSVAAIMPVYCHLYRSSDGVNYEPLTDVVPEGNPDFTYFDQVGVGTYYYELMLEYVYEGESCTSEPVLTSVEVTSVDEMNAGFNLYPNPANDKLTVESAVEMKEVKIYNLLGGLVRSVDQAGYKMEISLEGMPNGLYFIQMVGDEKTVSKRFIKK
jgi:gingipain K